MKYPSEPPAPLDQDEMDAQTKFRKKLNEELEQRYDEESAV